MEPRQSKPEHLRGCDMQNRLEQLETLARAAFDALVSIEDWQGSASTRQAATDALRRPEVKLIAAGFERPTRSNLKFRGAILDDLERMALRCECRNDAASKRSLRICCRSAGALDRSSWSWRTAIWRSGTLEPFQGCFHLLGFRRKSATVRPLARSIVLKAHRTSTRRAQNLKWLT